MESRCFLHRLLSPLHSVCCVCLSLSCFSLFLPSQFPVLGWRVGSQTFRELHTQAKCEGSSSVPVAPPKREARIYESVPAGSLPKYHLISFRCSLVLLFVPVSAVHDFRRSSHPHARARRLLTPKFTHALALSCLIDLITWISNFKQEIKLNQHWAL